MKNYIFDFDGTLADSKDCAVKSTQDAFRTAQLPIPSIEAIEYYMGIPIESSFKKMGAEHLLETDFEELLQSFRSFYKKYEETELKSFPHILEMLQSLKNNGKSCFVVSSKKTDVLHRNLQHLGLDVFCTDWIGSDRVSQYKPHPEGIFKIQQTYGILLQESVMIGDASFDIQMGKAAGCTTCAVSWGAHSEEQLQHEKPDFLVHSPLEIINI